MLSRLCVSHIALIDRLDISLPAGFIVLTGETGAGKSIIIDSVNLALGGRADRDLIQTGKEKASVEAVFDITNPSIEQKLIDIGIESEENSLILSRELSSSGRNTCRINGRLSSVSVLKESSELLIDIHGQHEHQQLLIPSNHIQYLDSFGHSKIDEIKELLKEKVKAWRALKSKLDGEWGNARQRALRIETLNEHVKEIDKHDLQVNEDLKLEEERKIMANAETLQSALTLAFEALEGGEDNFGALEAINQAEKQLSGISKYGNEYENLSSKLKDNFYQIQDIAFDLRDLREQAVFDPYRYEEIEQRLQIISYLKRKYGNNIEEILKFRDDASQELDRIEQYQAFAEKAGKEIEKVEQELYSISLELSNARKAAANALTESILRELSDLGMQKAEFSVKFEDFPEKKLGMSYSSQGLDQLEMLLSTNPGEPLKPLHKVASGGELSRIMLALKSLAADADACETLIFDEIDTGISGRIAAVVGEKMRKISRDHQVICVTHSPQIAAMADTHFLIEKHEDDGRVITTVRKLGEQEHIMEVARIMSGDDASDQAIAHAKDLVEKAKKA